MACEPHSGVLVALQVVLLAVGSATNSPCHSFDPSLAVNDAGFVPATEPYSGHFDPPLKRVNFIQSRRSKPLRSSLNGRRSRQLTHASHGSQHELVATSESQCMGMSNTSWTGLL